MTTVASSITSTTKDSYTDMDLTTSFAQIIVVKGDNYDEEQMRECPALLFEFYVENSSEKYHLENMNMLWSVTNNIPLRIIGMPTDAKIRVVPQFDEDYIARMANPHSTIDLAVYIDTDVVH